MIMNKDKKKRQGFSLIEIMVVIAIIALLGGIVGSKVMTSMAEAKVNAAITQIRAFDNALDQYKIRAKKYPKKEDGGLKALTREVGVTQEAIMDSIPLDPWGNKFIYLPPEGNQRKPIVRTLGADNKRGGKGEDADIDSLTIKKSNSEEGSNE